MNFVSKDLLSGIIYASDAHAVWEDLKEHFDNVNRVRIFQLHRGILRLSHGSDFVAVYFIKLKELWAEYDVLVPSPNCGCVKLKEYIVHLHQQRLMQFLDGLNDTYDQARRQILMKITDPTLNQAYAMITQDESQQSLGGSAMAEKVDHMAMQAGRCQGFRGKKQFLQCEHCHIKGHVKENCFKIIGYPEDFRGKKGHQGRDYRPKRPFTAVNNVEGPVTTSNSQGTSQQKGGDFFFTEVQYQQILHLLNKDAHNDNQTQANMAVSKLTRDLQCGARFLPKLCVFQDLYSGRVKEIVVDDYTRANWIILMQLKSETIIFLKQFFCMVKTQFNTCIKVIRTDNGKEFFNHQWSEFLQGHGVIHQSSCVHTPQQNGMVERKHRNILDTARDSRLFIPS
ncbi:uncharacterized protein LOC142164824 [Nicotiana tabacum]|uniref:Uncharacterized protein LOC142164824 n=1 Tax=Nicotiana tabacum TaxID=4097 RepID=A0AC58S3W2_TOBAC